VEFGIIDLEVFCLFSRKYIYIKECYDVSFIGYLMNCFLYMWRILVSSSRVIMNGEFKNVEKVTAFSFKRMWEITKNLKITD
jgi:hypothetical protein